MTCSECGIDLAQTTPFDGGRCVACWRTCATCSAFSRYRGEVVGNCDRGGPTPGEGSSDTGAHEWCSRWTPIDPYARLGIEPGLSGGESVK